MPYIDRNEDGSIKGQYTAAQYEGQEYIENYVPEVSFAEKASILENGVQQYLDSKAHEKGYDNILSACSYAAVENQFQAEGIAFLKWRSDVWAYLYQVYADVQNGAPEPTLETLIAGMPERGE